MKANEDVRQLLLADVSIDTIDSDLDAAFASMNEVRFYHYHFFSLLLK